jgi:hypothetical protein
MDPPPFSGHRWLCGLWFRVRRQECRDDDDRQKAAKGHDRRIIPDNVCYSRSMVRNAHHETRVPGPAPELPRVLGLTSVVGILVGTVIGSGIFFGLTVSAVIVLRRKRPDLVRPYRPWGYPVTPAIFILASLSISISTLLAELLRAVAGLGIIQIGVPAYWYWKKGRSTA